MKYSKSKISMIIFSTVLLGACASSGKSSGSSAAAGNFEKSSFCKGAIDQSGLEQALDIVAGDPIKFACKASFKYSSALVKSYTAIGATQAAERAARFSENLKNGTGNPGQISLIAVTDSTIEEKARIKELLMSEKNEESKKLFVEASKERQAALQEVMKGSVATFIAVKQVQADMESDDIFVKGRAIKKMVNIVKAIQVVPVIYETEKLIRNNQSEIDFIANVEFADLDKAPPPPPSGK